ncbi:hypothetical protein ASPVEDRAFT_34524 [Aspergillus versicolor CBS 583.65]|uniref:Saposin B-type domain-containing protein n=1 Tax=Aspergillus versicolor CBS 583.65 TaxID=1036611 RepID=A0A1L9Q3M9_ASPVE|nr:uncharacterized protein ASPVEDRAFT_34524 [Aspergillus versicolor CBS 583.65]OJJ08361.1 hypothetical protein ASPVEDRAFT_34524 [Aspergillus versicolor CBS 583.65]
MRLKLPSLTISLLTVIFLISIYALMNARPKPDPIMSEDEAGECLNCVHYLARVEDRVQKFKNSTENPQLFQYALQVSCRGLLYRGGHCVKFMHEFRKDLPRLMHTEDPYEACVSIASCR